MNHAITISDLVVWILVAGGIVGVLAILIGLVMMFNPFRSGH